MHAVLDGDQLPDDWFDDDFDDEIPPPPRWRRWVIVGVAAVVAVALAGTQLWNLVDRGSPPIADNGLEVCGFDYCDVQDAVRAAGLDLEMARLAQTYISEEQALALIDALLDRLGEGPVNVEIVDRLDGRTAGQYSPATRTITLERPVRAWIVVHEVAHVGSLGHGPDFIATLERMLPLTTDL